MHWLNYWDNTWKLIWFNSAVENFYFWVKFQPLSAGLVKWFLKMKNILQIANDYETIKFPFDVSVYTEWSNNLFLHPQN
jgi:hypothetical protein